jgi:hypothetical protein
VRPSATTGHRDDQQNRQSTPDCAGRGVRKDYVEAYKCYTFAASRFPAAQTEYRGLALRAYYDLADKMTTAQVAQAKKIAAEWKPKRTHARHGAPRSRPLSYKLHLAETKGYAVPISTRVHRRSAKMSRKITT